MSDDLDDLELRAGRRRYLQEQLDELKDHEPDHSTMPDSRQQRWEALMDMVARTAPAMLQGFLDGRDQPRAFVFGRIKDDGTAERVRQVQVALGNLRDHLGDEHERWPAGLEAALARVHADLIPLRQELRLLGREQALFPARQPRVLVDCPRCGFEQAADAPELEAVECIACHQLFAMPGVPPTPAEAAG